jgi:hypothetical protein
MGQALPHEMDAIAAALRALAEAAQ